MAQACPLLALPHDALTALLSHLGHQELLRVSATCTFLRQIASADHVWAPLCSPWEGKVDLQEWRAGVDSSVALFRLLKTLDGIAGYWATKDFSPRGRLLYVTWGQLSLIVYRVVTIQAVELKLQRFCEVIGLRDGSIKVELITMYSSSLDLCGINQRSNLFRGSRMKPEVYGALWRLCKAIVLSDEERELDLHVHLSTSEHVSDDNNGAENSTERESPEVSAFHRLIVEEPCHGKELAGLWSGIYGPHGVEVVNVTYTSEEIVGMKILGDPNVPCGQVTFKANLSTESTEIPSELQRSVDLWMFSPDEQFIILKLYHGFGRIAAHNFIHPEWIPGQLLVNQKNDIAFVWELDDNFVITFSKLDSSSLQNI